VVRPWRAPFPAVCALGKELRGATGAERDLVLAHSKRCVAREVLHKSGSRRERLLLSVLLSGLPAT
jgi:hypothetical protein